MTEVRMHQLFVVLDEVDDVLNQLSFSFLNLRFTLLLGGHLVSRQLIPTQINVHQTPVFRETL